MASNDNYPTPPTSFTPFPQYPNDDQLLRHTMARKYSRPQSITIDQHSEQWDGQQQVQLEQDAHSPAHVRNQTSSPYKPSIQSTGSPAIPSRLQASNSPGAQALLAQSTHLKNGKITPQSPCFVHSHLNKGLTLTDWLRGGGEAGTGGPKPTADNAQSRDLQRQHTPPSHSTSPRSTNSLGFIPSPSDLDFEDDEDDGVGSLTRQLAATAVGVREMSKQLGRARVRSNIQNIMIITKARDNRLIKLTRDLAVYLMLKPRDNGRGFVVYVDSQLRHSKRFDAAGIELEHPELFRPTPRRRSSSAFSVSSASSEPSPLSSINSSTSPNGSKQVNEDGQLRYWTSDMCSSSPHLFDFVVTLGGDGTVLFTSWLFQRIVPPVLPFALGSLGFLTNFDFEDHKEVMDMAIDSGIRVNLRMRFTCTVYRAVPVKESKRRKAVKKGETGEILMKNIEKGGWEALEGGYAGPGGAPVGTPKCKDKEVMCYTTRPVESFEVLNDLVVDRGPSPYVSLLELFGDEHHMTTVQADGLTVSTPTGSTAYSLSAGGSLVHPEIPAILITPICPHTLSFRPMLLPDTMELRICVPFNSRSTAWASFDGRGRVELKQGDHIKVTASQFPFPTVCADKQSTDWFHAISRTLKWNERERQKSFVVVEEGPEKSSEGDDARRKSKKVSSKPENAQPVPEDGELGSDDEEDEEDDAEEDEQEEEKFDIDDSSPEAAALANKGNVPDTNGAAQGSSSTEVSPNNTHSHLSPLIRAQLAASVGGGMEPNGGSISSSYTSDGGMESGITTPNRFCGPQPHPPKVHARHLIEALQDQYQHQQDEQQHPHHHAHQHHTELPTTGQQLSLASPSSPMFRSREEFQRSTRSPRTQQHNTDNAAPESPGGVFLRTPRFAESSLRTPRAHDLNPLHYIRSPGAGPNVNGGPPSAPPRGGASSRRINLGGPMGQGHTRSRSFGDVAHAAKPPTRRAFAAYGLDESDSNASD